MKCSPHNTVLPTAQLETADQLVSLDFRRGIDRPQWSLVKATYTQDVPFVGAAPVFTAANTISYSLQLELQDAEFVGAAGEQPSFDLFSGNPFVTPIEVGVLDTGRRTVHVRWTAPQLAKAWQRWVFRFYVAQGGGAPRPFPLAFVYLPPEGPEAVAARASSPGGDLGSDQAMSVDAAVPTVATIIQVVDGLPRYPDAFDYERVTLPNGVYPDPLINVLEREKPFLLQFTSSVGTFTPTEPTECNRGGSGGLSYPLKLQFLGVGDPNPQCGPALIPRGFQDSAVARSSRQGTVAWNEPGGEEVGRVASFLFSDTESKSQSVALLDPTLITGLPENPPG